MRPIQFISKVVDFIGPRLPLRLKLARKHRWCHGELRFFIFPRTYSELINQTKLQRNQSELALPADKFAVRSWVADRVGDQYLIPLYAVIDGPDELDFEALPSAFVMKGAHGCKMNFIVRDKSLVSAEQLRERIREWQALDYSEFAQEMHYQRIARRVVFDELLVDDGGLPPAEYKLWVFHQRTAIVQPINRADGNRRAHVNPEWRELAIRQEPPPGPPMPRPDNLEEMMAVAEKLAAGFKFVRVDLYACRGRIYFGEMTHTPGAGQALFDPPDFDRALGNLWRNGTAIPEKYYGPTPEGK